MFVCPECGAAQQVPGPCPADGTQAAPIGDDVLLGTQIGVYRVARLLGVGGMGRVYKGVHPAIGSRVAIKVLSRECSDRRDLVDRFFAEARAVNLIRHENIVNVLDLATLGDGRPYIIMEYLDGAPLSGVAEVALLRGTWLPLGGLARLAAEVLDALGAAHAKSIIHRDLKPDNVFVTPSGRAKVLDFGIAKLADLPVAAATRTGSLLGTPHYMSPEQAAGRSVDHRTDIYAMGVILFECMTGRKPFHAEALFDLLRQHIETPPPSPRGFRPDLPVELEQVILTALAKAPEQRFATASAMSMALQHATQHLPEAQWAPITGGGDAAITAPQAWTSSRPASWAGRSSTPPQPPSPNTPPVHLAHPTTVSASSGQLAPVAPQVRSSGKGTSIAIAAMLLVGGGVTAGVLATRDDKPTAGPVAAQEPAAPAPTPAPAAPAKPTGDPDEKDGEDAEDAEDADELAAVEAMIEKAGKDAMPQLRKQLQQLKGMHKLSDAERLERLGRLQQQLAKDLDTGLAEAFDTGGAGAAPAKPTAAAGAWPEAHALAFAGFNPKRVDTGKLIAFAMAQAKKEVPDAELFRIDADGVGPDGFADLTLPSHASDHGSITLRFRSPSRMERDPSVPVGVKQDWKCEFRIEAEVDGVGLRPLNGWACNKDKAVPAPRCTPAAIWKKAIAKQAPSSNAVASLGYRATGSRILWYFDIGSGMDKVFSQAFSDDC